MTAFALTISLLYVFLVTSLSRQRLPESILGGTFLFPTGGGTGTSTAPAFGQLLVGNANGTYTLTATSSIGLGGSGTVTSVAATVPTFLSIGGSPITTSGTLAISLSGTALPVSSGGTGLTSYTGNQLFYSNAAGSALVQIATSSPSLGLGLAYSGVLGAFVGGSAGSFSIATSSLFTGSTGQVGYFSAANTLSGTSSIFITQSGAVGIGSVTPTDVNVNSKLTVAGPGSQDIIASTTDITTASDAILQAYADTARTFLGSHGSTQVASRYGLTLGGWGEISLFTTKAIVPNGLVIGTNPAVPLVFGTNSAERMRILSGGNIGIGTTTPTNLLEVNGSIFAGTGVRFADGFTQTTGQQSFGTYDYAATTTDIFTLRSFHRASTIRSVDGVIDCPNGCTAAPAGMTIKFWHGTNRSASTTATALFTANPTFTSTTTLQSFSVNFNDNTLAANEILWFQVVGASTTQMSIDLTGYYTED